MDMRFYLRRFIGAISAFTLAVFIVLQFSLDKKFSQSPNDVEDGRHRQDIDSDVQHALSSLLADGIPVNQPTLDLVKVPPASSNYTLEVPDGHNNNVSHIWPSIFENEDRILAQMRLKPKPETSKRILVYKGLPHEAVGRQRFIDHKCPVTDCQLTSDQAEAGTVDAILFEGTISEPTYKLHKSRPPNQVWILFFLESPLHTMGLKHFYGKVNWTATYRRDSTMVTPYERWVQFPNVTSLPQTPDRNYASGKTKKVAWFVSNCHTTNGRMEYAKELAKYIDVDIYGNCGGLQCSRSDSKKCNEFLRKDYKFYLAFENSNCKDYITEKLYWNSYMNDVVPIVMGARPEDYLKVTPPHSHIHVDNFASPKALADYLTLLDTNDKLYNQYFRWKGTGHFIDTKFWCRLCSMLHEAANTNHVSNVNDLEYWWRDQGTCIGANSRGGWASWKQPKDLFSF